jgi:anaerobic magnesium-protoporphyrin IX monomethyl ester cyclase
MKESGCYQITISAESGNPRVLKDIIHKPTDLEQPKKVVGWCKEVGIETQVDFVIGFPGETWDEIRDTTNYAYELDADSVKFAVATPFPATELLREAVKKGMFPENYDFYTHDYLGFANPTMDCKEWTAQDLKVLRVMEWDRINFRTEEKKKRYAKVNELTMDELSEFRVETRKNLGVYFIDTEKDNRKDSTSKKISEVKKWETIRKTAADQAVVANETQHETI